jgi:hypothetical protein
MEIYTMTQRPSMPLNPACAPSALALEWAQAARPVATAAARASVSRVHQVQAELALTRIDGITGTNGTTGFMGNDVSTKRYADGGSGVPPRGRPV